MSLDEGGVEGGDPGAEALIARLPEGPYLSVHEIAAALGRHPVTIYQAGTRGELGRPHRLNTRGRPVRYLRGEVASYVRGRLTPKPDPARGHKGPRGKRRGRSDSGGRD